MSGLDDGKRSSHWLKSLPNLITGFRFFVVPIFVVLMLKPTEGRMLCSAAVFLLASVTDWLDGYIARAYDAESILGKLLDPLADKILVMSALVMLAAHPMGPKVPTWVVVILLAREFLVMGLRSLAAVKGSVVAASYWAKQKTGWTLAGITCLLIDRSYAFLGLELNFHFIGTLLIFLALILSVVSGTQYALRFKRLLFEG